MKIVYGVIGVVVLIVCIMGFLYVKRYVNNISVPMKVVTPEEGVRCAKLVSADGVAIDCWKVE